MNHETTNPQIMIATIQADGHDGRVEIWLSSGELNDLIEITCRDETYNDGDHYDAEIGPAVGVADAMRYISESWGTGWDLQWTPPKASSQT